MKYNKKRILALIVFQFVFMNFAPSFSAENQSQNLEKIKAELKTKSYDSNKIIEDLTKVVLESDNFDLEKEAFEKIEKMAFKNPKKVIKALTEITLKSKDSFMSGDAFEGLFKIPGHHTQLIESLTEVALKHEDIIMRKEVINIFKTMKADYPRQTIEALVRIFLYPNNDFSERQKATGILEDIKLENPDFSKILKKLIKKYFKKDERLDFLNRGLSTRSAFVRRHYSKIGIKRAKK